MNRKVFKECQVDNFQNVLSDDEEQPEMAMTLTDIVVRHRL